MLISILSESMIHNTPHVHTAPSNPFRKVKVYYGISDNINEVKSCRFDA
jgi:hypothetical protein